MNRNEVIKLIGKENWEEFGKFMRGQTIGFEGGVMDYYESDVMKFVGMLRRKEGERT